MAARRTPTTTAPRTTAKKVAAKKVAIKKSASSKPRSATHDSSLESRNLDPNLRPYVPSKRIAEKYVARQIHGVWDADILTRARESDHNVLLMGDTGSGKTMLGEAYAAHYELLYYSIPNDVSIDPTAYFGKMVPTEEVGRFAWEDGPATQLVRTGGVLNISEVNFMLPKIAATLYPLLDHRRYITLLGHNQEIVRAHRAPEPDGKGGLRKTCWCDLPEDECRRHLLLVIADMNPNYRGTQELNAAFKNRYGIKVKWDYDEEVEKKLVPSATLLSVVKDIRAAKQEVRTPVSTNMMMELLDFAKDPRLGLEFAIANFVNAFPTGEANSVAKLLDLSSTALANDVAFLRQQAESASEDDEGLEEMELEFGEDD